MAVLPNKCYDILALQIFVRDVESLAVVVAQITSFGNPLTKAAHFSGGITHALLVQLHPLAASDSARSDRASEILVSSGSRCSKLVLISR
jgi:hypothetical protein